MPRKRPFRAALLVAALLAQIPAQLLAQSDPATADAETARLIVKFDTAGRSGFRSSLRRSHAMWTSTAG
jgi:hypothetical protein